MDRTPSEFVIDEEPQPVSIATSTSQLRAQVTKLVNRRAELAAALSQTGRREERKKREFFLALLKVADAFDRIFRDTNLADMDEISRNVVGSFRVTSILLEDVLDREDVIPMDELEGRSYDPNSQEVVDVEEQAEGPDGIVLEVKERGYWWRGRVLRRAKVIVSEKV